MLSIFRQGLWDTGLPQHIGLFHLGVTSAPDWHNVSYSWYSDNQKKAPIKKNYSKWVIFNNDKYFAKMLKCLFLSIWQQLNRKKKFIIITTVLKKKCWWFWSFFFHPKTMTRTFRKPRKSKILPPCFAQQFFYSGILSRH